MRDSNHTEDFTPSATRPSGNSLPVSSIEFHYGVDCIVNMIIKLGQIVYLRYELRKEGLVTVQPLLFVVLTPMESLGVYS